MPDHLLGAESDLETTLGNSEGQRSGLDRCPRPTGTTNVPPAHEPEKPLVLVETITRCGWDPSAGHEETSRGGFPGQGAALHNRQGGAVALDSDSYRDPRPPTAPDPGLLHPGPASPTPARPRAHPPPGAGTPRRRAGTRGCCSGTRSRSAAPGRPATHSVAERPGRLIRSLPRAAPISAPARTRKRARGRK